ncbi:MAG: transporter substrate-binding domain-containing protein [Holosporales bacterium]|jgi:ABC-type amino acid transport substrate-binding protein|nr:transporter substrate-binding domain-containing protein [Holosporales bacterium]
MKLVRILLALLSLVSCGIIVFTLEFSSRQSGDVDIGVDSVDPEKFSYKHINYQFKRSPPGSDKDKHFGDIDDIVKRGELVVLSRSDDYIPLFQMKAKNGYVGEAMDFAKSMADALGVKLTIRMLYDSCNDIVAAIAKNEGDIGISEISYTDERSAKVLYTNPHITANLCILVNRMALKQLNICTIHELFANEGSIIAGHKNTSYDYYARQFATRAKVVSEEDWDNAIVKNLMNNKFSATIKDSIVVNLLLRKYPRYCLRLLPIMLKDNVDSYAAVVNKKSVALCVWVNKFLAIRGSNNRSIESLIHKYREFIK